MRRLPGILLLWAVLLLPAAASVQVVDDTGRTVRLEQPARRILVLAPHLAETLLELGLEGRVAALTPYPGMPPALAGLPRIAPLGPLDRERVLLLRPDLALAWDSGNRPADLRWLERAGIPVYRSEPRRLEEIAATLEKVALLAGEPERGERAARRFRKALEAACRSRRGAPVLRTYYEIWPDPPITLGGRHWLNRVLERARLRNLFADVPAGAFTADRESLLARRPELVLSSGPGEGFAPPGVPRIRVPPLLERPGPRLAEGLAALCRKIPTGVSETADRQEPPLRRH